MPRKRREVINVSIHPDNFDQVHDVLDEIKERLLPISGTVCRLLLEFEKRGFKFESEVE
jgi:tetrahydromethanopterin S-methyltransferase subunit G